MKSEYMMLTVGTVVDTNDPQQLGRLRVSCPKWGDTRTTLVTDIPWATYITPFGGILTRGSRGPEEANTSGPVAYGMWAIPKVGATVVCMLLDGDPGHRAWLGSIHAEHMMHTLPMGRFLQDGTSGPLSSTENPIEPLAANMKAAFQQDVDAPEYKTRAAENQAASISNTIMDKVPSATADERNSADDRTGYQKSRLRPDLIFKETKGNFDPQTYSITTPGMHSFIMDDSLKNGKIRIRSTSGNQIILDDTNERIYISTAEGKNYIEMDRAGNVEIYAERRISIHAKKDINFTTEETFRVSAKNIHMRSSEDMRFHADTDVSVLADQSVRVQADAGPMEIESGTGGIKIESAASLNVTAVLGPVNLFSGSSLIIQAAGAMSMSSTAGGAGGNMEMKIKGKIRIVADEFHVNTTTSATSNPGPIRFSSGGTIDLTTDPNFNISLDAGGTGTIDLNSGAALSAESSTPTDATQTGLGGTTISGAGKFAYTTSRVPIHEPWGRISNDPNQTDQDVIANPVSFVLNMTTTSSTLELPYTSSEANKTDLGDDLGRNNKWRR